LILNQVVLSTRIREESRALFSARQAKETISHELNATARWLEPGDEPSATIYVEGQGDWPLSPRQLVDIIERRFWQNIRELIADALSLSDNNDLEHPDKKVNAVVLAGGTCQADIFQHLFKRDFVGYPQLQETRFIKCHDYQVAVAQGLAIEAHANNRLYEFKPTRVSPFLQSDLHFFVSNNRDHVGRPDDLEPSDARLKAKIPGVLLPAPLSLTSLIGESPEWSFRLKQKPDAVFYGFRSVPPGSPPPTSLDNEPPRIVQVKRGRERPGAKFKLRVTVRDDGFADLGLEAWYQKEGQVLYALDPLDLHDLADMGGDVFLGMDFGTSSTTLAYVNLRDPSALEALPSSYWVEEPVSRRARELEIEAKGLLGDDWTAKKILERWNQTILGDYVYHSNRIEGSALGRGTTIRVLDQVEEGRSRRSAEVIGEIAEKFSYIDANGVVQVASRPIKDHIAAVNLRDAFLFVNEIATDPEYPFTAFILKQIHDLIMRGEDDVSPGEYKKRPVKISQTAFVPPDPVHIDSLMEEMFNTLNTEDFVCRPVIYQAAYAHARFVSIHPFQDGNGRLARLLVNYFLWKANLPGILLPWQNRTRYYDALEECNTNELPVRGDLTDLATLFCDLFEDSLEFVKNNILKVTPEPGPERDPKEPVIEQLATPDRLGRLLAKITSSKFAISEDEQFENWGNAFRRLIAETVGHCEVTSRAFKNS
jgi:fido (protein-threonine AMPylation protein)